MLLSRRGVVHLHAVDRLLDGARAVLIAADVSSFLEVEVDVLVDCSFHWADGRADRRAALALESELHGRHAFPQLHIYKTPVISSVHTATVT
jgi:hypothetical protein